MKKNSFLRKIKKSNRVSFIRDQRGLTFFELIVVVVIIGIISSVTIFNYQGYRDSVELSNDAHKIVMAVREVRVRALAVRESTVGSFGSRFQVGYGLYFSSEPGNEFSYIYYVDLDDDYLYEDTSTVDCSGGECMKLGFLSKRNKVVDICKLIDGGMVEFCHPNINSLNLTFKRPNTDAVLTFDHPAGGLDYYGAVVKLESPQGREISVIIKETGISSVR